jgi:hypothetical protein
MFQRSEKAVTVSTLPMNSCGSCPGAVLSGESTYKAVWRRGREIGAKFVSVVRSGFALQN